MRLKTPDTWRLWAYAGMAFDSTLTYADRPGFRCGTCHPYPVYDVAAGEPLPLVEFPLIAMDSTLYSHLYCAMSPSEGRQTILQLGARCSAVGGVFSMLVHADLPEEWRSVLEEVIPQLARGCRAEERA